MYNIFHIFLSYFHIFIILFVCLTLVKCTLLILRSVSLILYTCIEQNSPLKVFKIFLSLFQNKIPLRSFIITYYYYMLFLLLIGFNNPRFSIPPRPPFHLLNLNGHTFIGHNIFLFKF